MISLQSTFDKTLFKLVKVIDKSNLYMEFGRNQVTNEF